MEIAEAILLFISFLVLLSLIIANHVKRCRSEKSLRDVMSVIECRKGSYRPPEKDYGELVEHNRHERDRLILSIALVALLWRDKERERREPVAEK